MLYLEDYLEMIEHLPQELRDRFTEMREMDLSVQNSMDSLEKRVKQLFLECQKGNGELPSGADGEYQAILQAYYRTLDDADEKVNLANQMYDLVDKYLRRLDTELHKFKCELEADNKGITELLEKRSLELDAPGSMTQSQSSSQQKENRCMEYGKQHASNMFQRKWPRSEKRRNSNPSVHTNQEKRQAVTASLPTDARHSTLQAVQSIPPVSVNFSLGSFGASNAIAVAASQAIAATELLQQGRRTPTFKASVEAINTGAHEFGIGRELAGAAHTALQAIQQDHVNIKKQKKKWSGNPSMSSSASQGSQAMPPSLIIHSTAPVSSSVVETTQVASDAADSDWTYDPNEPRWCICNQVSYGDMVACDNQDCPFEWFHYQCVGITAPPKGKWYCPQCISSMRRRGIRKH